MGFSLMTVKPPEVSVNIDTRKIEQKLSELAGAQSKELPKIRKAIEVIAGTRPKKLARLENARDMVLDKLNQYDCFTPEELEGMKEVDELYTRLDGLYQEIATEEEKFIYGPNNPEEGVEKEKLNRRGKLK